MESLIIQPSEHTPSVKCDFEKGLVEFTGRSIPENANDFYTPICDWLTQYKDTSKTELQFIFCLDYINSISYKMIFELMLIAEEIKEGGKNVSVIWKYEEDDEEILEEGENFSTKINIDFSFEEVPE